MSCHRATAIGLVAMAGVDLLANRTCSGACACATQAEQATKAASVNRNLIPTPRSMGISCCTKSARRPTALALKPDFCCDLGNPLSLYSSGRAIVAAHSSSSKSCKSSPCRGVGRGSSDSQEGAVRCVTSLQQVTRTTGCARRFGTDLRNECETKYGTRSQTAGGGEGAIDCNEPRRPNGRLALKSQRA